MQIVVSGIQEMLLKPLRYEEMDVPSSCSAFWSKCFSKDRKGVIPN